MLAIGVSISKYWWPWCCCGQ